MNDIFNEGHAVMRQHRPCPLLIEKIIKLALSRFRIGNISRMSSYLTLSLFLKVAPIPGLIHVARKISRLGHVNVMAAHPAEVEECMAARIPLRAADDNDIDMSQSNCFVKQM